MSVENAKKFLQRLESDEAFRKKIADADGFEARVAIVKGEGFDFSKADMEKAHPTSDGELSDEELESVAGGSASSVITGIATTISTAIALAG